MKQLMIVLYEVFSRSEGSAQIDISDSKEHAEIPN